jgi:hypothetical protein
LLDPGQLDPGAEIERAAPNRQLCQDLDLAQPARDPRSAIRPARRAPRAARRTGPRPQ